MLGKLSRTESGEWEDKKGNFEKKKISVEASEIKLKNDCAEIAGS